MCEHSEDCFTKCPYDICPSLFDEEPLETSEEKT
jgi:hypothetical protein